MVFFSFGTCCQLVLTSIFVESTLGFWLVRGYSNSPSAIPKICSRLSTTNAVTPLETSEIFHSPFHPQPKKNWWPQSSVTNIQSFHLWILWPFLGSFFCYPWFAKLKDHIFQPKCGTTPSPGKKQQTPETWWKMEAWWLCWLGREPMWNQIKKGDCKILFGGLGIMFIDYPPWN